jgi:shikimate kinase/3-dehydroquinate synthase
MSKPNRNIVITGFMGTGKSAVSQIVAKALGRTLVDTDKTIEREFGKSIPNIFASPTLGERAFRDAEARVCNELSKKQNLVIATGGGTLVPRQNLNALSQGASIFCLNATLQTTLNRLQDARDRPLLTSMQDKRSELQALLDDRRHAYARVFHQIQTDKLEPEQVAKRILDLAKLDDQLSGPNTLMVKTPPEGCYPIWIHDQVLSQLPSLLQWVQVPSRRIALVSNPRVRLLHGETLSNALQSSGFEVLSIDIPDGEERKTLDTVAQLYHELLKHKVSRHDTLVALGGGVTGDIAGFAAATYLRGISFVQVPTTLLSMLDSSVGSKTGVDLEQGKNLVGAFKHPKAVLIDPSMLHTLPREELLAGLGEAVKHAIIGDVELFELLEHFDPQRTSGKALEALIARAVRVKVSVVEEDPFEQGRRAVLNLGHTFGHAFELVSQFQIRHGEAVAVGLVAAANLAHMLGLCNEQLPRRIVQLLQQIGLQTSFEGHSPKTIFDAMAHDKKRSNQGLRFILPRAIGDVDIFDVSDDSIILDAISSVSQLSSH